MLFAYDIVLLGDTGEEISGRLETWHKFYKYTVLIWVEVRRTNYIECKFNKGKITPSLEVQVRDHTTSPTITISCVHSTKLWKNNQHSVAQVVDTWAP
jgi:hypothetical protein